MNYPVRRKHRNHFSFPSFIEAINDVAQATAAHSKAAFSPAVNITENDDRFLISLAIPGYSKKDVEISLDKHKLIIKSDVKQDTDAEKLDYKRKEFSKSSFEKSFILPDNVDKENLKAQYKNGVLHLDIAKMPEAKPVSIKVS